MVAAEIRNASFIRGDGNLWWAGSLQKGFDWLVARNVPDEDVVLIINDDSFIEPDFLQTGVDLMAESGDVLLLPQAFCRETNGLLDCGIHVDWRRLKFEPPLSSDEIDCFSTRGLFLRMGAFRRIGGFHPILLPHYLSDYEFTIRAHRKGFRLVCDSRLRLWMDESSTGYH
jgi:GT2 family glycosyltransferase